MEHAKSTKADDAVTNRQFQRFLSTAKLPTQWEGKVKTLKDVILMPLIYQDLLFADNYIF